MTAFGVGVLWPRIHLVAVLVLAIGVGARLSTRIASSGRPIRWMRQSGWAMAAGLAAATLITGPLTHRRSGRLIAGLPAAPGDARSVLLIILDTVRARSLGLYDDTLTTSPRLVELASRGVLFDRMMSPSSWTLPSHAAMFTGLPPRELSADWEVPFDAQTPVVAEAFARAGYATGAFVANKIAAGPASGLSRGFHTYRVDVLSLGRMLVGSSLPRWILYSPRLRETGLYAAVLVRKDGRHVNEQFLDWFDGLEGRPFFAFLNYMDAHEPYWPPAEFAARRDGSRLPGMVHPEASTDADRAADALAAYQGSIRYLDHVIGELLDELERRSVLQNITVIVTADHGEAFGRHGVTTHGNALYLSQLHVPMLVVAAGDDEARGRIASLASLTDVAATMLDLAGLPQGDIRGRSLSRYWRASETQGTPSEVFASLRFRPRPDDSWPISHGPMGAVISDSAYLIRDGAGSVELFFHDGLVDDTINLAGRTAVLPLEVHLRTLLDQSIPRSSGPPRAATAHPEPARWRR
jgi:arylsulfatase A-like enzyme